MEVGSEQVTTAVYKTMVQPTVCWTSPSMYIIKVKKNKKLGNYRTSETHDPVTHLAHYLLTCLARYIAESSSVSAQHYTF